MYTELLQFAGALVVFAVALFVWFKVIYAPRRTLERWQGERVPARSEIRKASGEDHQRL